MADGYIRLLPRISHAINLRPASLFGFEHSWRKLPWHRLDLCGHAIHIRHRPSNFGKTKPCLIFCIYISLRSFTMLFHSWHSPLWGALATLFYSAHVATAIQLDTGNTGKQYLLHCSCEVSAERIANACFWRRLDKSGSTNMCRRYDVFLQRESNRYADRTVTWSVLLVGGRRDVWTDGRILVLYWRRHLQRRRYAGNVGAGRPS